MLKTRKLDPPVSDGTQLLPLHSSGSDSNIQGNNGVSDYFWNVISTYGKLYVFRMIEKI